MAEGDRLRDEFETVEAPQLPTSQQEVATQAFETAVSPLREQFGKRLETTTEDLARRGIQFGGVGGEGLRDVFKEQQRVEGQIAGRIGTQLGQTAMDQAFAASEAAKSRQLQEQLTTSGREFQAEQSQLGRDFSAEQSQLGRDFSAEEAQRQREFGLTTQEAAQQFQAEQAQFGRTFTREENKLQRDFQTAFQEAGFGFQAGERELERQEFRNNQALQLVLSGNLNQDQVQEQIGSLLGPGAVLTNEDELTLQRLAAASGLSVDDYTRIRSAIGTAQGENIMGFTEEQETDFEGNKLYVRPDGSVTTDETTRVQRGDWTVYEPNEPSMKRTPNVNAYIQDPVAQRQFQVELANIQAKAQRDVAKEQSKGGKVLCTELYMQGKLPKKIYLADLKEGLKANPVTVMGYHYWANPVVTLMQESKVFTSVMKPIVSSWAYHMAYKQGVVASPNLLGYVLEGVGIPLSYCIGRCLLLFRKGGVQVG